MRRSVAIAGLTAALSLGVTPALAFQETPVPPPEAGTEAVPQAKPPTLQLGTPQASADPHAESQSGLNVFGYNLLPKLDFGLEVLYGQEQQQFELQKPPPTLEESGDVSVLGKVKRRF